MYNEIPSDLNEVKNNWTEMSKLESSYHRMESQDQTITIGNDIQKEYLYTTCSIINLIDVIFVLFPACFSVMLMLLFKWWCKGELKRHNLRDSYIAMLQNNMALV